MIREGQGIYFTAFVLRIQPECSSPGLSHHSFERPVVAKIDEQCRVSGIPLIVGAYRAGHGRPEIAAVLDGFVEHGQSRVQAWTIILRRRFHRSHVQWQASVRASDEQG